MNEEVSKINKKKILFKETTVPPYFNPLTEEIAIVPSTVQYQVLFFYSFNVQMNFVKKQKSVWGKYSSAILDFLFRKEICAESKEEKGETSSMWWVWVYLWKPCQADCTQDVQA